MVYSCEEINGKEGLYKETLKKIILNGKEICGLASLMENHEILRIVELEKGGYIVIKKYG